MNLSWGKKIVVLGMMSRMPVAGVIWQTMHYLIGLQRLGYDVYYVEAHARTPSMLMEREDDDSSGRAAAFIASVMRRFDLGDRWAFHALHADGRYYGLSEGQLKQLYRSAALLINLHGGTMPLPEHSATDRLVYLETDPVAPQIELCDNRQQTIDFLEQHCAFFTFGENYGNPDCELPVSECFNFQPTRQPVVVDLWQPYNNDAGCMFSTIGSWRQLGREVTFQGEVYHWSKHFEFLKFIDLPSRTTQAFELALNRYDEADKRMLEGKGWAVRDALGFSTDLNAYREYIARSRGEFTVAKDQNVRLRSGWFSDRSATYLAAGRPVITQETGFSSVLPTGQGLFGFSRMEEILQALESINSTYEHHCRAASALAREYFNYDVVLPRLLADLGLPHPGGTPRVETGEGTANQELAEPEENLAGKESSNPFPPSLVLTPTSRHPTTLPEATVKTVLASSVPLSLARYDVVCFPAEGWYSHSQRLQETMARFAHHGHRVFYLKLDPSLSPTSADSFRTRNLAPNLFEIQLPAAGGSNANDGVIGLQEDSTLLEGLAALRRAYGIEASVAYVQLPSLGAVAMRARERWGWKVVYDRMDQEEYFSLADGSLAEQQRALIGQADLVVEMKAAPQERGCEHTERRIALPEQQTCTERWQRIDSSIQATLKRVSIVIVTFDNLVYTKLCLESLLANTEYPGYEVIVVDNGSSDDTPDYLRYLTRQHPQVRALFNTDNLGFARANNQGLAIATGDVLVLLNNDTLVPRGWLARLVRHLEDPTVGLVGPVTNDASNEAKIDVPYHSYGEFVQFTRDHTQTHEGELFDVQMLTMFCLAMRREVYERVGSLDERFEVGTFEDDDYAMRVRTAGYRVVCAEDVFVHHFGQASFGKLVPTGEYGKLLGSNQQRFEQKWGTHWESHQRRLSPRYQRLIRRIREVVRERLPRGATVLVVSKGDDELLNLYGRRGWHFPQDADGLYAGYYPASSTAAIAQLEVLRSKGAEFLLFPNTALWWLEYYPEFKRHLESRYGLVASQEDTCLIFALREAEVDQPGAVAQAKSTHSTLSEEASA